jgi:hypothetical protein
MTSRMRRPTGRRALTEFVRFHDRVYEDHGAHWPATRDGLKRS